MFISKYLLRKGQIKKNRLHTELYTMADNPIRFQDHPLKTVGVVFTRIC